MIYGEKGKRWMEGEEVGNYWVFFGLTRKILDL
mgnify:CR=1 FL=1